MRALPAGPIKIRRRVVTELVRIMLFGYLLLYGPVLWLFWNVRLPGFVAGALILAYALAHSAAASSAPTNKLEDWYLSLWVDRSKWPASLGSDQDPRQIPDLPGNAPPEQSIFPRGPDIRP